MNYYGEYAHLVYKPADPLEVLEATIADQGRRLKSLERRLSMSIARLEARVEALES